MIRKDIFAVKEKDPSLSDDWCYVFMTRDPDVARNRARDIRMNHSLGIRRYSEIVHPAQRIVDVFLLAGNTIQ